MRLRRLWLLLLFGILFGILGCASKGGYGLIEFEYYSAGDPSFRSHVELKTVVLTIGDRTVRFDDPIGEELATRILAKNDQFKRCQFTSDLSQGGGVIDIVAIDNSWCSIAESDFRAFFSDELNDVCTRAELSETVRGFSLCLPLSR
jgi:hypothetical protein